MPNLVRAVALDVDGTIAFGDRIDPDIVAAIKSLRYQGVRVVVATGRTLAALDQVFPGLRQIADVVVAENGGVVAGPDGEQPLASPVPTTLRAAMAARGVDCDAGQVLLACSTAHDVVALEEIARLGLDCALSRNRDSLMVLPPGVSKGSGLKVALAGLGMSVHNVVAVGDAENDHSLFSAAEFAVAVADAAPALREHADVVLDRPGADGTAEFLRGAVLRGTTRAFSRRRTLTLGTYVDGHEAATIPSAQATVLITGGSGRGKSYAAGLVAERALQAGYHVFLVDPEGDHVALADLPDVELVSGDRGVPSAEGVVARIAARRGVVLNLAGVAQADAEPFLVDLAQRVESLRASRGVPHWVVPDEAHWLLGSDGPWRPAFDAVFGGYCATTYQPEQLAPEVLAAVDVVVSVTAPVDTLLGGSAAGPAKMLRAAAGTARLLRATDEGPARTLRLDRRSTSHVRHRHKYTETALPESKWFWFRSATGRAAVAASLVDFDLALSEADPEALDWHVVHGDFSHWIRDTLQDGSLADVVASAERDAVARRRADLEHAREQIRHAVRDRYLKPR